MWSGLDGGWCAIPATPRAEHAGLTEQVDVGQARAPRTPVRAGGDLFRRAPEPDHVAQARHRRRQTHLIEPQCELRGRNQCVTVEFVDLLLQHIVVEGMVQHQRAAGQKPHRERRGKARKGARRERGQNPRALRHVAFERQRERAGDHAEMGARHGTKAIRRHVEGNQRRLAAILDHRARGGGGGRNGPVERSHAFREVLAKATDVADRETFCGGVHGDVGMDNAVDPAGGHDCARAGPVQGNRKVGLAP